MKSHRGVTTRRRIVSGAVVLVAAGLAAALVGGPTATAANTSRVYIVQGLPGTTIDVQIDGKSVANDAKQATISPAVTVSAGQHKLTVRSSGSVLLENTFTVKANDSSDIVVHRPASPTGKPVITVFPLDLSAVPADKASVTVAHTAAVPPADIKVNGKVLFSNVANGESLHVVVPAGTYTVQIVPTGQAGPSILGPADLPVKGGSLTNVYAIGEPKSGTMNVVVHEIRLSETGTGKPSTVNTGTGGQAARLGLTTWSN
jgi:Domain of unknown function (DUF4397)